MVDRLRQAFNAQEQLALLFLFVSAVIGIGIGLVDRADPDRFAEFTVIKGAVQAPGVSGLADYMNAAPATGAARVPVITGMVDSLSRPRAGENPGDFVDLNSATVADLERLPSIGPKMAARIVEYRRRNGDFEAVGELVRVRGIGMRTLEKLRPLLRPE